jgi:DNA primase
MNEAKNDPIKADLIRDMVVSISKIPDRIQRNLYSGMFSNYGYFRAGVSTLAQLVQKDTAEVGKNKSKNINVRNCKSEILPTRKS